MRVIVEGPDGSGKSTLVGILSERLGLPIQKGEGPEKWPGEINERADWWIRSHHLSEAIMDRHPCISHPIYSRYNSEVSQMDLGFIELFYQCPSLIIYCRGHEKLNHVPKAYDSLDHLKRVAANHHAICKDYDRWALEHAHVLYDYTRVGSERIVSLVKGVLHHV